MQEQGYDVTKSALRRLEEGTYNTDEGALLWWNYYDTATLATGDLEKGLFSEPKGNGKGGHLTNWPAANQMPQAQNFEVKAFEFYYIPAIQLTQAAYIAMINTLKDAFFSFKIFNSAPSIQIPLIQALGATLPAIVTGGAVGDQVVNRSQFNGVWETPIEIVLAAKANIECNIALATAVPATMNNDRIIVAMVGGLVRLNS